MKKNCLIGVGLLVLFIVFTVLVKTVDVKEIGRQGTEVGMATVNEAFNDLTGYHEGLYKATEVVGYVAFLVIGIFGGVGLWQLIKRKSLLKVDRDILILGGFYVIVLGCYVLFEKVVINYRPICAGDETLEASYPSSHTLLLVAVMMTAIMQIAVRVRKASARNGLIAACAVVGVFVALGRAICGVHWLTDIIGGLMLAISLSIIYYALAFSGKMCYPYTHISGNPMARVYAGPDPEAIRRKSLKKEENILTAGVYGGPDPAEIRRKPRKKDESTLTADVYAGPAMPEDDKE